MTTESLPHPNAPKEIHFGVSTRTFLPKEQGESFNQQDAVIIFQGFGAMPDARSYDTLAQAYADQYNRRTIVVNMISRGRLKDSFQDEAKETYKHLQSMGVRDAIFYGYSRGTAVALEEVLACQEDSGDEDKRIHAKAVILCAPISITKNDPLKLLTEFALDSARTPGSNKTSLSRLRRDPKTHEILDPNVELTKAQKARQTIQATKDVLGGVLAEAIKTGLGWYPFRFFHDIYQIAQRNPRISEINCPVIILQGKDDVPLRPRGDIKNGQMANQDEDGIVQTALEKLFPNSPHISRILVERDSHHIFPLLRSSQIAIVTSALLNHWEGIRPRFRKTYIAPTVEPAQTDVQDDLKQTANTDKDASQEIKDPSLFTHDLNETIIPKALESPTVGEILAICYAYYKQPIPKELQNYLLETARRNQGKLSLTLKLFTELIGSREHSDNFTGDYLANMFIKAFSLTHSDNDGIRFHHLKSTYQEVRTLLIAQNTTPDNLTATLNSAIDKLIQ